jgi:16S rRNA (adenine1518-N6/adenine1519-N6)-dimethyltransferase
MAGMRAQLVQVDDGGSEQDQDEQSAPGGTPPSALLGPAEVRALARRLGIQPTKQLGQNFVIDPNTIRRIVRSAQLVPGETVLEVGPGLGSLTLGLLEAGHPVTAVEIDPELAAELPATVAARLPSAADSFRLVQADALRIRELPGPAPTAMVANLPYNVAVPVLLHLLEQFPSLERVLVLVQLEVADRLAAEPGGRIYGVPSVKARWYGQVRKAGVIGKNVFWPAPNIESGLVALIRHSPEQDPARGGGAGQPAEGAAEPSAEGAAATRAEVFAVIDAAFAQRRKTLRAALAGWAGSAARAEEVLRRAGVDPAARGESLGVRQYVAIAIAAREPARDTARDTVEEQQ